MGSKAVSDLSKSETSCDAIISDEKNEFLAKLYLNGYKIGFVFCEDSSNVLLKKIEELNANDKCKYLVCCCGNKDTASGSILKYIKETLDNYGEDYRLKLNKKNKYDVVTRIIQTLKKFCGFNDNALSAKELIKLRESAIKYINKFYSKDKNLLTTDNNAQEAFEAFNNEWGKLNPYTADRDDELKIKSLYGYALLIYSDALRILTEKDSHIAIEVESLQDYIEDYCSRRENKYYFDIKSDLLYLLSICWCNLDKEGNAIFAIKRHIFYNFCLITNYTYSVTNAYSFRKCSTFLYQALLNNSINITSPIEFNDPFDCPILSIQGNNNDKISALLNKAYSESLKIACFSSNILLPFVNPNDEWEIIRNKKKLHRSIAEFKNPLMWAHYADSHRGICIKYVFPEDFSKIGGTSQTMVSGFGDVKYSRESLSKLQHAKGVSFKDAFFLKGEEWKYENELRFFCFDFNGTGKYSSYGDTSKCIEAVYFGLRCSNEDKKAIHNLLSNTRFERKSKKWNDETKQIEEQIKTYPIRFYQMEKDPNNFGRLKAVRI